MDEATKHAIESDKPVMIFNIQSVGQMNPSATTVNNTYYGDQFVPKGQMNGKPTKPAKDTRDSSLPKITRKSKQEQEKPRELMTFNKRGITVSHLTLLLQQMVKDGWLPADTSEADFLALFSGERSECKITWANKHGKSTLVYFFKHMDFEGVISVPKGFTIPNILMGHFVDEGGKFLTNLDNGDAPAEKAAPEIMSYIKILKIDANRMGRRSARNDYQDEDFTGYGEELNPFELEEEGLTVHNKRGF